MKFQKNKNFNVIKYPTPEYGLDEIVLEDLNN